MSFYFRKCESECLKPRPKGCNHACLQPCHPGPCQPCGQMMKIWCNCGITQLYVKCGPWVAASEAEKLVMSCCKDQCPKLISCGHRYEIIFLTKVVPTLIRYLMGTSIYQILSRKKTYTRLKTDV